MRQVPVRYLLIGNGRVARHFSHYFSLLNLEVTAWHRGEPLEALTEKAAQASHILILISDKAIEDFIKSHLSNTQAYLIHCSGALLTKTAFGAHPLMTFGTSLYDLKAYQNIPFIIDDNAPDFAALLPGLPNPHQRLPRTLKAKYHALCVLSGNFTCLLWQKLFAGFQELNLAPELAHPYLQQQVRNLIDNPHTALTGPLVRNDQETIANNIAALAQDPIQAIYQSFVQYYKERQ